MLPPDCRHHVLVLVFLLSSSSLPVSRQQEGESEDVTQDTLISELLSEGTDDYKGRLVNVTTLEGCTAAFPWSYDPLLGQPAALALIKTGAPPQTLLTKNGGGSKDEEEEAEGRESRFVFTESAGVVIRDVRTEDAGVYEVRVVFENLSLPVYQQAQLFVTEAADMRYNPKVICTTDACNLEENSTSAAMTVHGSFPFTIGYFLRLSALAHCGVEELRTVVQYTNQQYGDTYHCCEEPASDLCSCFIDVTSPVNYTVHVHLLYPHRDYENIPVKETVITFIQREVAVPRPTAITSPYRETYIAGASLLILAILCLLVFLLVRWRAAWKSCDPKYRKQESDIYKPLNNSGSLTGQPAEKIEMIPIQQAAATPKIEPTIPKSDEKLPKSGRKLPKSDRKLPKPKKEIKEEIISPRRKSNVPFRPKSYENLLFIDQ